MSYLFLAIAIVSEVIATSLLKATAEFTRLWPSLGVVAGYLLAFYFLTLTLRTVPVGIAYAISPRCMVVLVASPWGASRERTFVVLGKGCSIRRDVQSGSLKI